MFIDWEKEMRRSVRWILAAGAAIAAAFAPVPAFTQAQPATAPSHELIGFWLTTPHPELAIPPGKPETIPFTLRNENLPPQRAELEVSGVPNDWKWSLKGGNREVNAVIVSPNATEEVKLELTPPTGATGKNVAIDVKARYGSETADLPQQAVARLSPQTLYGEVTAMLLDPSARSVGPLLFDQMQGAIVGAPLPTVQSLLVVWPQISGLVAAMILLFTLAYVVFQRQEVRA